MANPGILVRARSDKQLIQDECLLIKNDANLFVLSGTGSAIASYDNAGTIRMDQRSSRPVRVPELDLFQCQVKGQLCPKFH